MWICTAALKLRCCCIYTGARYLCQQVFDSLLDTVPFPFNLLIDWLLPRPKQTRGRVPGPPKTIALVLAETSFSKSSIQQLADVISWCSQTELTHISVYDPRGDQFISSTKPFTHGNVHACTFCMWVWQLEILSSHAHGGLIQKFNSRWQCRSCQGAAACTGFVTVQNEQRCSAEELHHSGIASETPSANKDVCLYH